MENNTQEKNDESKNDTNLSDEVIETSIEVAIDSIINGGIKVRDSIFDGFTI